MMDEGYAGVTYRAVAAIVGVTGGAVQYYFPTLDDLFVAVIQWRGEQNIQRLAEALVRRSDQPLPRPVGVQPRRVHVGSDLGVPRPGQPPQVDSLGDCSDDRARPTSPARSRQLEGQGHGRRHRWPVPGRPPLPHYRNTQADSARTRGRRLHVTRGDGRSDREVSRFRGAFGTTKTATFIGRQQEKALLVSREVGSQPVKAGMESHPRTVEVGTRRAFSRSISQRGNRLSTSSSAMRPSRRARAAPKQKCAP